MDRITKGVSMTRETINNEYDQIKSKDLGDRASDFTSESLDRIERSLSNLNFKIKEGAYDLENTTREKVDQFLEEIDMLRDTVRSKRKEIKAKGLQEKSEEVLENMRNRYDKISSRILKE